MEAYPSKTFLFCFCFSRIKQNYFFVFLLGFHIWEEILLGAGQYLGHFFIKYYSTYVLESSTILTFAMLGTAGIISDVIIA